MPDRIESSKAGFSGGFKGKVKKFGQTLGVGESRSRSQSPSAPASSVPSIDQIQPWSPMRADPITPIAVDSRESVVRNRRQQDASIRDLWQAAFETLTQEHKDALETSTEDADHAKPPTSLIEDVVSLTTEKCAQYEAGGWHIERKGQEDINVRDKAKSLLCSVLTFKDLIDAGLKFDASGYGALAWSVVSFGLKLVQNDKDRMDAIFEASDFLAQVLARYANIEAYYRDIQIPDTENFENAIVGVYIAVLQYSAKVKASQRAGRTRRVFESVASLTGQPLQRLKEVVNSRDNTTEEWRTLVEHQYRLKESCEISQKADDLLIEVTRTVNGLKVLQRSVLTAEEDGMLDWLSSLKYFGKQNRLKKEVQRTNPQSGQWFLESETFSTWDFLPQSFLWLYGPSGCGKSSLCSTIVETLEQEKSRVLAYWYFDIDNSETQDVENMLCSLLRQLSAGMDRFPDAIRQLSDDHRKRGSRPNTNELLLALHLIISSLGKDVSLVLDGLDEYPGDSGHAQWLELLEVIQDIMDQGFDNLHFLVTSRNQEDIRDGLSRLSNPPREMDVEKLLLFDLEMFFDNVMQSSPALQRLGETTKDRIRDRLMANEQRRFRWTALNLDELQLCRGNDRQARQALYHIPDTVEAKYLQVLDSIDRHDLESAETIFRWLCVSKRPLTNIELAEAAGLSDPSDVRRICTSNLVTSSAETVNVGGRKDEFQVVRFAHSSVKEYLLSKSLASAPGKASRFYVSIPKAHADVALCCLKYLNHQHEALWPRQTLLKVPLLQYSAEYWHVHAKSIGSSLNETLEGDIERAAYELFRPSFSQSFSNWLRLADPEESNNPPNPDRNPETYPEPLYYALLLGLEKVSQKLIEENVDVNGRCGIEGTALQLAAHRGYTSIVKILLEKGSFVNVEGSCHGSALYASTIQGHIDIVEALLKAEADVNRQEGEYGNVLQVASYFPYAEIFHGLLRRAADVSVAGGRYGSPLGAACAAGHFKYVYYLLSRGANPNGPGGILASPLQAALLSGHEDIMSRLLEKGARFKRSGSILWQEAYLRLRKENELLMTLFEKKLTSSSKVPQELTLDQQLLAAVIVRSPQDVASEHRSRVISKLAEPHGRKGYWQSMERFIALVTDLEPVSDDPEQAGYLYNRLFWAGLFLAIPSAFSTGAEETVILLEQTVRVAARVRTYENVAFETANDRIGRNRFYDEVDFRETEAVNHDRLKQNITQIYSHIFLVLAKSLEQNSANRVELVVQALTRKKENARLLDAINSLSEFCREEVDAIRLADLVRAKGKILALEKKIKWTKECMESRIAKMESTMQTEVKAEVGKQLRENLLFLMPELREKIEGSSRSELPQTSTPSHPASPSSSSGVEIAAAVLTN